MEIKYFENVWSNGENQLISNKMEKFLYPKKYENYQHHTTRILPFHH